MNLNERQTILIVDDLPMNIQLLAENLKEDYRVLIATHGQRALEIVHSEDPPDLILLDIIMPDLDGYEVCKILKNDTKTKDIPIIFITSKSESLDEERGLNHGAVDYITKPFHIPVVRSRIKTHLNLKLKTDLLEKLALIDGLTNLYNRRFFDKRLKEMVNTARRDGVGLALFVVDVDYFKKYNDHYGHLKGDEALKNIAQALSLAVLRPLDLVFRYGGEEFTVLLYDCDEEGAKKVALRIKNQIRLLKIEHGPSNISRYITVSIGISVVDKIKDNELLSKLLLSEADKALYQAKDEGRNCFVLKKME